MRHTCKTLIADSKRAGFEVTESSSRTLVKSARLSLMIYEDGTIHRADVPLDMAKRMRVKDAYSVLGFPIDTDIED